MRIKIIAVFIILIIIFSINAEGEKRRLSGSNLNSLNILNSKINTSSLNPNFENEVSYIINPKIAFTKNCGQIENEEILFYDQNNGIWFTNDGIWYEFREELVTNNNEPKNLIDTVMESNHNMNRVYQRLIVKQEFVGVNNVIPTGNRKMECYSNFFYGNNSKNWKTNVPIYQEIFYENLYDGIDLRFYININGLKYDLIVHPGADVKQIEIEFKGVDKLEIDKFNNIIVNTPFGSLTDRDLNIYQKYNKNQYQIDGKFVLLNDFEYGFELLQEYRKDEILIIDPEIRLEFSTYFGGTGADLGYNVESDSIGNVYVTGLTYSSDFPTTTGAFDTIFNGTGDVIVFKLNPSMSKLYFSTFIGGSAVEYGRDIAVDTSNNIYITGITSSADFPTTKNAYDPSYNNLDDIFILKLNQNGSSLIFSTFIGGSGHEWGLSINVNSAGNVFITGRTQSSNFPVTSGATNFGNFDVIILKLNNIGSSLIYSRVFGGSNFDCGVDSVIDSAGNIYVTGYTQSNNFNITSGVYDPFWNGNYDAFILKLNKSGLSLDYSTYVGGSNSDSGFGIDLDNKGNAVITGSTSGPNFPNTTGVFDPTYNSLADGFICKVDTKGSKLLFSTYIGGSNQDYGNDIAVDSDGSIYVIGQTTSSNFPTTQDAFNESYIGSTDIFFLKCDPNATQIIYSTFIGGTNTETPMGMDLDSSGHLYCTGGTSSTDFPFSAGAINTSNNGGNDIFVIKFATRMILNVNSISIMKDSIPTDIIYSKLCPYTFSIGITDTANITDLKTVKLIVDPQNTNIQFILNLSTREFKKLNDPNNHILLESSSKVLNNIYWWIIDYNLTFSWTFPHEELIDVQIYATSKMLKPAWYNATKMFRVENDLVFNGSLSVKGEDNRTINENDLIRGGEILKWEGLIPQYENTTNIYPLEDEFDVFVWDEDGNCWIDSPPSGGPFYVESFAPKKTFNTSYTYTINLTGMPNDVDRTNERFTIRLERLPNDCDSTNETYTVKIDAENVTFTNPLPIEELWQRSTEVNVGIKILDKGGGFVNGTTVMWTTSSSNGERWTDWKSVKGLKSNISIFAQDYVTLKEGKDNLVKWRAIDSVGNGPNQSEPHRINIDTKKVMFSKAFPLVSDISKKENVEFGITISDITSGVDATRIEYAVSYDKGITWNEWIRVEGLENGSLVEVTVNLSFPNGTDNMIKWHAYDIAGNGPTETEPILIAINTWVPKIIPKVELISPLKGSIINVSNIKLTWVLENILNQNITYDLYFGNQSPISILETNLTDSSYQLDGLIDGETYFWYVIPWLENDKGSCISGVWWFEIKFPKVQKSYKLDINGPESFSIYPGENKTIELSITNLGSDIDLIKIKLQLGNLTEYVSLMDYSTLKLTSKDSGVRKLNISIPKNARTGIYAIIITAISLNSGESEEDSHILTLEIKDLEIVDDDPVIEEPIGTKEDSSEDMFLYLLIAIIIIIILILAVVMLVHKKKKPLEKDLLTAGTFTVKPGELPSSVITLEQVDGTDQSEMLTGPKVAVTAEQSLGETIKIPQLVKSTQIQQPTVAPTSSQVPQLPQLPPARIKDETKMGEQLEVESQTSAKSTSTAPQPTISATGPEVHLPDTPSVSQPIPQIGKTIEPTSQQYRTEIEQVQIPTILQPKIDQKLTVESNIAKKDEPDKEVKISTPGTQPEKDQQQISQQPQQSIQPSQSQVPSKVQIQQQNQNICPNCGMQMAFDQQSNSYNCLWCKK